jgi:HlyD family secretion protein
MRDQNRAARLRQKYSRWFLHACLLATILPTGCSKPAEKEPEVTVQAAAAKTDTISRIVTAEVILYPLNQAAITPKITAPVKKFYVNRGATVRRGQLLAVLENGDLQGAVLDNKGSYQQAQGNYETTTRSSLPEELQKSEGDVKTAKEALEAQQKLYDNRQSLYEQGALPRKDLDQAAVALAQARGQYDLAVKHLNALKSGVELEQVKSAEGQLTSAKGKYLGAEAQLSYSEIRSPIAGVVTDRPIYEGEIATPSSPIITVMDLSQVIAKAHIPEEAAALLKKGNPASLTIPGKEESVQGKVTLVSPALDPNSTTVEVWIQAPNSDQSLRPGISAKVSMISETVPNALVVPAAAILTSADGSSSVMVIGSDGRANKRDVQTGIQERDQIQIKSGLNAGERVVTTGAYGLPDKTKVRVESAASAPPPAPGKD